MNANELRIGNLILLPNGEIAKVGYEIIRALIVLQDKPNYKPIPLTEEWLKKLGFSVINESSAGKRYGYVIKGFFSSDLTFTFWKTTKEAGKFFRSDLELKSVHQLQNLYFSLTGNELVFRS